MVTPATDGVPISSWLTPVPNLSLSREALGFFAVGQFAIKKT